MSKDCKFLFMPSHCWIYRGWDPAFRKRRWLTRIFGYRFECRDCEKKRWLP